MQANSDDKEKACEKSSSIVMGWQEFTAGRFLKACIAEMTNGFL